MSRETITFRQFDPSRELSEIDAIEKLVSKDLSEPYSAYVYQYFTKDWPQLAVLAETGDNDAVGTIVASMRPHKNRQRGYIAMLAVREDFRGRGIAKELINRVVDTLVEVGCDEVTLETEQTNEAALHLYQNLGFIRTRRMHRYYLNTSDAFRLILPLTGKSVKSTVTGY